MMAPPFGSTLNDKKVQESMRGVAEAGQRPVSSLFMVQNVLNGGELSPHMLARADQPRYQTGCEKLLNMVPLPQGGITKRPGFRHMGSPARGADGTGAVRLMPFVFSATESRVLEFSGDAGGVVMRVWMPGGELVGAPFTLSLPGWTPEDLAGMCLAQSADVLLLAHPKHAPAKISRHADNDWRYEVINWMPALPAPTIIYYAASGTSPEGETSRSSYSYVATAVDEETGEESMPSAEVTVTDAAPLSQSYFIKLGVGKVPGASEYRIYKKKGGVYGYIGRIAASNELKLDRYLRLDGVRLSGLSVAFRPLTISGTFRLTPGRYVAVTRCELKLEGFNDNERYVREYHVALREDTAGSPLWRCDKTGDMLVWAADPPLPGSTPDAPVSPPTGNWSWYVVTGSTVLTGDFACRPTSWGHAGGAPVADGISDVTEAQGLIFEDRNIGADTEDTPPGHRNPFDGPGNYPAVVFLHQQRLGFAASYNRPLTVWLSSSGNFESMAASVPPKDDDAIEVTLAATQANRIIWCQTDRDALAVGTEGGEWLLSGADGGALTPNSLSFQAQTFHGSQAGMVPLRAGSGLLYLQRGGHVAREYSYSYTSDRYESGDLSLLARHVLRDSPIKAWTWQEEPNRIAWCALGNGTMAGLTYMREHEVVAWHRHSTPGGFVEDMTCIPGDDGLDQLWLVVKRNGTRRIERMDPFEGAFFDADATLRNKVVQLNAVAEDGRTDWTENDTRKAIEEAGMASVQQWWNAFGRDEGVCPWDNPEACRNAGYVYYVANGGGSVADADAHRDGKERQAFPARCIPTLPETSLQNGSTLMRVRKINAVKCRVIESMPFQARMGNNPALPVPIRGAGFAERADWALPLGAGWREGDRLELIFDGPDPVTVLAVQTTVELADMAGGQK